MLNTTSLFFAQSYQDAWDDYMRSMTRRTFPCWDYVILTASNEQQAEGFNQQLAERQAAGFLPTRTHFAVLPDPEGKRVGSGGATLNVIKYIAEREGSSDFSGKKILVIHSGGDSKRVPQYSALGKIFSPVPHQFQNGRLSSLFDEFMVGMSGVPSRMKDGMLVLSGDVMLLFNPLQIDYTGKGAVAISFKEDVETGKNHGVYKMGEDGYVARFLHKMSVEKLTAEGAVNEHGNVDIDTGAVIFSAEMVGALYSLIGNENGTDPEKFDHYVNEKVRLSLYGDFLYPLAQESTLEQFYNEKPEGSFCPELTECRTQVWEVLHNFSMKLLRLSPAKFIHFGTTREVLKMMTQGVEEYAGLNWASQVAASTLQKDIAVYNGIVEEKAHIGAESYIENSVVGEGSEVGEHCVLSYVELNGETIPAGVALHGLKQKDGQMVVRIYGTDDNPKDMDRFLGVNLQSMLEINGIAPEELWDSADHSLWMAKLYPVCANMAEAVKHALNIYAMSRGQGDVELWRNTQRVSLCAGFNAADPQWIIDWTAKLHEMVQMEDLVCCINEKRTWQEAAEIFAGVPVSEYQKEWVEKRLETADFSERMRLNYFMGRIIRGVEGEKYIDRCFTEIQKTVLAGTVKGLKENTTCSIQHDEYTVRLPLRVNWGGGWSDTPPYCNENGGTVLNAAILLNGEMPVHVTMKRIPEYKVVFDSRDMDTHGEFSDIKALQDCSDPYDPFALPKAALVACGVIPEEGSSLQTVLERLGGGFFMSTEVTGVPKGSGLGTSSILAGACVKCIFEFLGIEYTEDELYDHVLIMEQIMSTGGGWQDQVGGVTPGIKYITSRPGLHQQLKVAHVELAPETMAELNERFALIYTGQRRLARNLLRDVVGRYIGAQPDALEVLYEIQRSAALMRFELEKGNVDGFAQLLTEHWGLSKKLDKGSTNTCIDQIFVAIEDMICGKMISGAGGGGFLQVILKKGVTKEALHERLQEVFQDSGVAVWDCEIVE